MSPIAIFLYSPFLLYRFVTLFLKRTESGAGSTVYLLLRGAGPAPGPLCPRQQRGESAVRRFTLRLGHYVTLKRRESVSIEPFFCTALPLRSGGAKALYNNSAAGAGYSALTKTVVANSNRQTTAGSQNGIIKTVYSLDTLRLKNSVTNSCTSYPPCRAGSVDTGNARAIVGYCRNVGLLAINGLTVCTIFIPDYNNMFFIRKYQKRPNLGLLDFSS